MNLKHRKMRTINYINSWDKFIVTCYYPNSKKIIHYGTENYERNTNDTCEVGIWKIKKNNQIN